MYVYIEEILFGPNVMVKYRVYRFGICTLVIFVISSRDVLWLSD